MNDLMSDVRLAGTDAPAAANPLGDGRGDLEAGTSSAGLQAFFTEVDEIKRDLADIKQLQGEVESLHQQGKTIIKSRDVKAHQEVMQNKVNVVNKLARSAKAKIDALDKENKKAKDATGQAIGSAEMRTRTNVTLGLRTNLKNLMSEFSVMRTRMEEEYRQLVSKRVQTVTGEQPSEDDVDKIIEGGDGENIFQTAMSDQAGRGRVLDCLAEIRERNVAVKDLLQSLLELHQIFLDMSVMVEAQGAQLGDIQQQVESANNYVAGGTTAIVEAKNLQKNTRKWIMFGAIVVFLIIVVIVLAVVLSIKPWQ